jgi:hypothetical protein
MSTLDAKHFPQLVEEYRQWRAYDVARTPAEVRRALGEIGATLSSAAACIGEYTSGNPDISGETSMRAAWRLVNLEIRESQPQMRPLLDSNIIEQTLFDWAAAATNATKRVPAKKYSRSALKMAAGRVYSLRTLAGLRCTSTLTGDAVKELIRIAREAGDSSITHEAARKAMKVAIAYQGRERRKKPAV